MCSSSVKLLIFVGLVCAVKLSAASQIEHTRNWGEKDIVGSRFTHFKQMMSILLLRREYTLTFPNNFKIVDPKAKQLVVRGIEFFDKTDSTCEAPKVEILKGGIGKHSVTLKVVSARGCGLDSRIIISAEHSEAVVPVEATEDDEKVKPPQKVVDKKSKKPQNDD